MRASKSESAVRELTQMFDDDTQQDGCLQQCLVSTLVTAVVQGTTIFLRDKHAQITWDSRIAQLHLYLTSNPLQTLRESALRTVDSNVPAEVLLGSVLLLFQCERGISTHHSDTRYRRFAKFIFTVLNILWVYAGDDAFKIIPALFL